MVQKRNPDNKSKKRDEHFESMTVKSVTRNCNAFIVLKMKQRKIKLQASYESTKNLNMGINFCVRESRENVAIDYKSCDDAIPASLIDTTIRVHC